LKIYNVNSEGKEFIQSIFSTNRILGEAAILGEFMTYPTNCIALTEAILWQLSKKNFLMLLNNHPKIYFLISKNLAKRFYYKSMIAKEVSFENPEHRIITLLLYLKHFIYNSQEPFEYCVELSRQDIANLTGLRVETVIRSVKKLEANNRLIIRNHKIHL
jgi:CRP-like cAMP-binding protein